MEEEKLDPRLLGAKLKWQTYKMPKPTWDHDHCEFCWAKFMEPGTKDTLPEGYRFEAEDIWICNDCFQKYHKPYGWTVE